MPTQPVIGRFDIPPAPDVANHLTFNLSKKHILVRVAVMQVGIGIPQCLDRVTAFDLVCYLAGIDHGNHFRIIRLAAKAAQLHLRKIGNLDLMLSGNYFNDAGYRENEWEKRGRASLNV